MSGHSAGGQFSCHMMTVLSGTIKGAGCSKSASFMTRPRDWKNAEPTAETMSAISITNIDALNAAGDIDPISNLENRAVIILSGADDPGLPPKNQIA
jgi:hypothetical protein